MVYRCLFEQSGTFKNEFKKLGFEAYDYDIKNEFGETDFQLDLYNEILRCYDGEPTIFDEFTSNDVVLAFFPCIRFDAQILLWFRGDNYCERNWSDIKKLEYAIKLQRELTVNYIILSKLIIILKQRGTGLIIENPYSTQSYLITHFPIKPTIIDKDRSLKGDYMKKPTAYWFIGIEPKNNVVDEKVIIKEKQTITSLWNDKKRETKRSLISSDYARYFIKQYIIDKEEQ